MISIFAVVSGLLSAWIRSSILQRSCVSRVRTLGGLVIYEEQYAYREWQSDNPHEEPAFSSEWRWPPGILRRAVGIDFLDAVHTVDMKGAKVTNDEVRRIRESFPHAKIRW